MDNTPTIPAVLDYSRAWLAEGNNGSYLASITECRGVTGDYVIFCVYGCYEYNIDPTEHASCPYGLLRVPHNLLHPSLDITALPTSDSLTREMSDHWATISPENDFDLAFAFPPGFCDPSKSRISYQPTRPGLTLGDRRDRTRLTADYAGTTKSTRTIRDSQDSDSPTIRGVPHGSLANTKPERVDTVKKFLRNALTFHGLRRGTSSMSLRSQ